MNLSALERLAEDLKNDVYAGDLSYRIAMHEAGHVLAAELNRIGMEVVLPALDPHHHYLAAEVVDDGDYVVTGALPIEDDAMINNQDHYTATVLPLAGLSDEAVAQVCLSGYAAERVFLNAPHYDYEPYRSAGDCSALVEHLNDASLLVPAIDAAAPWPEQATMVSTRVRSDHAHSFFTTVFESGNADKIGKLVLAVMDSSIGAQQFAMLCSERSKLIEIADVLFSRWKDNGFQQTHVTFPLT